MLTALCALTLGFMPQDTTPHSTTSLLTSVSTFEPGKPFLVGFQIKMDKGWHCYWKNPGDSGERTELTPKLPAGWKIESAAWNEPVIWPTPKRIKAADIVTYGYEGAPIFVFRVIPPKGAKSGVIGVDANWLICADMCVMAKDSVRKTLMASAKAKPDKTAAATLEAAMKAAPTGRANASAKAYRKDSLIVLEWEGRSMTKSPAGGYFFSAEPGVIDHAKPQTFSVLVAGRSIKGGLPISPFANKPPTRLKGVLVLPDGRQGSLIDVPITGDK